MPSTEKQKAKERRFRQLDILSDVENADVMLGNYSREDEGDHQSDSELNLDPVSIRPQQNSNVVGEDFRSLLTNSRENSKITIETTRMISNEVSSQVTRRLNETKDSFYFQIQNANATAITEKVLPFVQNTLGTQGRSNFTIVDLGSDGLQEGPRTNNFTMVDLRSSRLQRNPEVENSQKTWANRPKTCSAQENRRHLSGGSPVESDVGEQNRDTCLDMFLFANNYSVF